MRTTRDIEGLLDELESCSADGLEDQDLDFKQWDAASMDKSVRLVVHMAVCMANGGGGTVVFGVADKVLGRPGAILGVPPEVDVNRSNLGVGRMFSALLIEGKEPPDIREIGESVTLAFMKRELLPAFRLFVAEESRAGRDLNVDALLVLQYLHS